ncbi:MAG: hypothetical protein D6790_20605 [Caldilineae bacterium]|nr:MAG: hypothetical protein D6790_20605 [Caldilineae bacterium]
MGEAMGQTTGIMLLVAGLAGGLVLFFDWRLFLPGAVALQLAFGWIIAGTFPFPPAWQILYGLLVFLAALILVLPLFQGWAQPSKRLPSDTAFRGLLLLLAAFFLLSVDVQDFLPLVDATLARLVAWLALCALLLFAVSGDALHTGAGVILWCITAQSLLTTLWTLPLVVVLFALVLLATSLACSYLLLAENTALARQHRPLTDITFPDRVSAPWSQGHDALLVRGLASLGRVRRVLVRRVRQGVGS